MTGASLIDDDFAVFCQVADGQWRQVIHSNEEGVSVLPHPLSFHELWTHNPALPVSESAESHETVQWADLQCALPDPTVDTWGYAMTYPSHKKEVELEQSFFFRKLGAAVSANAAIKFRPYLDYEAELGLLMQRSKPHRFAYLLANDWTDRGIQARNYDAGDMAPGFSRAKSFDGALQVGSLLLVGNEAVWERLEVELLVNGERRQDLKGRECLIRPRQIFAEIFKEKGASEWALVLTGTTAGVQFQVPELWQKIVLIVRSGFSKKKATERWLEQLSFLRPGDRVELSSELLGRNAATVVKE